jgi:hypothetical protein
MFGFNSMRPGGGQGGNLQSIWDHITANRPELAAMLQQRFGSPEQWGQRSGVPAWKAAAANRQPVGSATAAAATGRPMRGDHPRPWDNPNHPRYGHVRPPRGPRGGPGNVIG